MLRQLAPRAVMPPSPKTSAWITRATEMEMQAAQGPRMIAMSVPPIACPVEPPITGTLNIMMMNAKAAPRAMRGICLVLSDFLTLRAATTQMGMMAMSSTT